MRDFTSDLRDVRRRLDEAETYLSIAENRERFAVLEAEIADPALWDDPERAKKLNAEYANIRDDLTTFDDLTEQLADVEVLHELAREEDDESQEPEIDDAIAAIAGSGSISSSCAACSPASTTSATASCRSTPRTAASTRRTSREMLLRMYERWCERRGFTITLNDVSEGAEAGIMSAEVTIAVAMRTA